MRLGLGLKTPMALVLGMALLWACSDDDPVTPSNDPPAGLAATASGSTGINLTWTVATGVTQYLLERAQGALQQARPFPTTTPGSSRRRSTVTGSRQSGAPAPPHFPARSAPRPGRLSKST
jgi:hypothetical protein